MEQNRTQGSVFENLLSFSLPFLLSYFLQTLYGMADLFLIGQFGDVAATTAVSVGSQVIHMLTVVIVGLAMGTTVSIARAVGSHDRAAVCGIIGNTVTLFMSLSAVLTVGLVAATRPIVTAMATPQEAAEGTAAYLTVCFLGIPFITAYNLLSAVFRGLGDSKSPMKFIAVACAANIALDCLFMGVFRMGPVGAALGTTLSQGISVALSAAVILKRREQAGILLSKADFRPQKTRLREILRVGVPIAVQDGLIQVAFMTITVIANHRGLDDAAAVGIVEKIIGFLFLVPSSMLSSVSALGAQNIGAGKPERAEKTLYGAMLIAAGFGLTVAVLMQFFAEPTVSLFVDSETVVRMGGQYLRGYIWDCALAGIHFCFSGYFCACGKSGLSFLHNLTAILLVRIPGAYFASANFPDTLFPMGLATAAGSLLSVVLCALLFAVQKKRGATA